MTSPMLKESPSTLFVWRTWHAVCALGAAAALLVIVVMLAGSTRREHTLTRERELARLESLAQTIAATATLGTFETASLAQAVGVDSITMITTGSTQAEATPGLLRATAPLASGDGYVIIENRPPRSGSLAGAAPAAALSLLIAGGAGALGLLFARGTAGLRRVASGLAAIERGESDRELLLIDERFGSVATTWNQLVHPDDGPGPLSQTPHEERRDTHIPGGSISTSTLDAISVGIVGIDRGGRLLFCNGAAATMLGADRRTVISEAFAEVETLADAGDAIRAVVDGETMRRTVELSRGESGNEHILRVGIRSLRKTDGAHVMLMIEDITQQRLTEAARDSFVAQATHELRTPLTNIKLAAEEAIDSVNDDPATVSMSLNIVNQEARRLERVVTDMLSVSEMEAATMSLNIDDVSPAQLLDDLEADYANQAKERSIKLTFNKAAKLEQVFGDREKIALLLHNIVGNAVKYTPDGGAVTVTASQDADDWRVEVRDTGPGIAPDEHEKVFEKFYRASNAKDSDVVGTGLGLALAAEIARLHGGEITLDSEQGRGCTFCVRLPRGTQAAGSDGKRAA